MYYYSIFQHLFKFVPRYRFEKSAEKHSSDRYCEHFIAIRQFKMILYEWIKQNLKIKNFLDTSKNAVMTQIWDALILYLLLSYIKFTGKCRYGITEPANRLRDMLMSDFALVEVLNLKRDTLKIPPDWNAPEQLDLFANCCNLF